MTGAPDAEDAWWTEVEAALAIGDRVVNTADEFNAGCDHIVQLLHDSSTLLERGSAGTAVFLAIAAFEEITKVHVGMYRGKTEPVSRRKNPLYRHHLKHMIGAAPTIAMSERITKAIGEAATEKLMGLARSGKLVVLRESALYFERRDGRLQTPAKVVDATFARTLLLFVLEAFDDALVGYTNHSTDLGRTADDMFLKWANDTND